MWGAICWGYCFTLCSLASSNVSTVSQGIVRMQGLPFRATEDDIVSRLLNTSLLLCVCALGRGVLIISSINISTTNKLTFTISVVSVTYPESRYKY